MLTTEKSAIQSIDIQKEVEINAPLNVAFAALLEQLGPANQTPDGAPLPMKLEPWPGGRWYRDLGDQHGHLWGHVQVIKPNTLLEIVGPMFMSYAVASHAQYRLTENDRGVTLSLRHQAIGMILPEHRDGVDMGWSSWLQRIAKAAESTHHPKPNRK